MQNRFIRFRPCDFTNDAQDNLRVVTRAEHASNDVKRSKPMSFICPQCNTTFILEGRKLNTAIRNRDRGRAGPFCGRSCAGKYGKSVQVGSSKLEVKKIVPEYTTKKAE